MNIGDVFIDKYPTEAIGFAFSNDARILEITPDGEHRRFQIVKNPERTLDELKAAKLEEVNASYDTATSALVSTYPSTELLTFDKQENEARAWLADNTTSTPLIDALALGRGIDKAELVRRIIAKAGAFAVATGYLTGQRQKYEDQLEAATTAEEIAAIVPEYTMPETTTEKVKLSPYYDL